MSVLVVLVSPPFLTNATIRPKYVLIGMGKSNWGVI